MRDPPRRTRAAHVLALLAIVTGMQGCSAAAPSRGEPPPTEAGAPGEDFQDFLDALTVRRANLDVSGTIPQTALGRDGRRVVVNDRPLLVFEYPSREDARTAAAEISPDGERVAEVEMGWMAPPHWFQHGRLLVLYLGRDADILVLLEDVLGHQVAGANGLPGH